VYFRVIQSVEQHQRHYGHRPLFGDFASFVKGQLTSYHSAQLDQSRKGDCASLRAEAGEPMDAVMAEASVPIAGGVMQDKQSIWEGRF
jgi:hypothetical protein